MSDLAWTPGWRRREMFAARAFERERPWAQRRPPGLEA